MSNGTWEGAGRAGATRSERGTVLQAAAQVVRAPLPFALFWERTVIFRQTEKSGGGHSRNRGLTVGSLQQVPGTNKGMWGADFRKVFFNFAARTLPYYELQGLFSLLFRNLSFIQWKCLEQGVL